jgi:hypothetical protein
MRPSAVANGDVERALQHDKVLFLVGMDVQRNSVVGIGQDLKDRKGSQSLLRRNAYPEPLAGRDLQPLGVIALAARACRGCLYYRHLNSP